METDVPNTTENPVPAASSPEPAKPSARRFDFRRPVFLPSAEWRKVRREVEEFAESLGSLLSTYLRLDFALQLGKLQTISFEEFAATLPARSQFALFSIEPLRGVSVLELRPAIGLAIVDRLLGGPGKPASLDRDLTEMEVALLDQSVQLMLGEWCKQWSELQELRAEIIGHENNAKFLQFAASDTTLLVVTLEARMGETVDQIQLAFPYSTIEPLITKLTESNQQAAPAAPATPAPSKPAWSQHLDDVPLTLTAQWPTLKLTTRSAMSLRLGDIMDLPVDGSEKVEVRVGKVAKFKGSLGTRDGKWAIQIKTVFRT